MGQVSRYLRSTKDGYIHYCPACEAAHHYVVNKINGGPAWTFNGNVERPSFTPSMHIRFRRIGDPPGMNHSGVCHYFLTDGQLQFCGDSTHALAGKAVPLPELPDWMQSDRYGDGNP